MAAIEVRGLHKTFRLPHERRTTLAERVLGLFRPVPYERFEALRGVDIDIEHGSFVGIIGNNGSGKSTLLKVIAGLLVPDAGTLRVDGRISALLELGLGFSPELTVRENVELYGAVLGYPRREMGARIETAIRFAELERFAAAKLKNLSTGMQMRLAFATALQAASDILLLDEILAVGDASFQRKCLEVFAELKRRRRTVVLVSHNMGQVRQYCDRAILIENGQVALSGTPDVVVTRHIESGGKLMLGSGRRETSLGDGRMRLCEGWLEDAGGTRVTASRSGERLTLVLVAEAAEDTESPTYGVAVRDWTSSYIYAINTLWLGMRTETVRAGQKVEVRVPLLLALRNGDYTIDSALSDSAGVVGHDWVNSIVNFKVTGSMSREGVADLQATFSFRPLAEQGSRVASVEGQQ